MLKYLNRASSVQNLGLIILAQFIFLNLAWNHSYLGEKTVLIENYYAFKDDPIFQYRALPSLVYCVVTLGCHARELGLNPPVNSTYSIFQLIWDFVALNISLFAIRALFFPRREQRVDSSHIFAPTMIVVWLVAFSFFFVPNRALFYPYDFSDFAILLILAALSMRTDKKAEIMACLVTCVGAFNKETVFIFPFVYFVLRFADTGFLHALKIFSFLLGCGLVGKFGAIAFADLLMDGQRNVEYAINQLHQNTDQLKNPLFYLSMSSATAFAYLAVIGIRKYLNVVDWCIIALAIGAFAILFVTGISRELRIYLPITIMFIVILARHREETFNLVRAS